ncbi:MAG: hypothetical protein FWD86_00875 [Firmicutes bacterium]|nr:hypothetical protein [Bacillota bacterium]
MDKKSNPTKQKSIGFIKKYAAAFAALIVLSVAAFSLSACPYRDVAGTYHGVNSSNEAFILTLSANGNFSITGPYLHPVMIRDATGRYTSFSGTFSKEDNTITLTFSAQDGGSRLTVTVLSSGNLQRLTGSFNGVSSWIVQ